MTFAHLEEKFKKANCNLIGLSIDGLYSHIAWLRTIKNKIKFNGMDSIEVKFPLIEDISINVAKKYGMVQCGESKTQAVRAVFCVDPEGSVRVLIYYPLNLGPNFDELYRTLIAMQTSDKFNIAALTDWNPGDDVIVSPAGPCGVAVERMTGTNDLKCEDWFFCTKKLDQDLVLNEILKK